ncbi:MAG: hypothetical protein A2Y81_11995 [Nitrospirae bacterium RBG_13_43_8]|nr:MAG: hypothetical protein A2Y81_11995 [Nitrospirae bacterium RBG_13_43_8]
MRMLRFADEFGPEKILEVHNPKSGLMGVLVIDSTALGVGKGGIRMTPTVNTEEVFRLARAMTWKTALAELPFGGAKSGIIADVKKITKEQKSILMTEFGRALKPVAPCEYVAAPDVYTAEEEMRCFVEGNGSLKSATGKPHDLGGIPHELGSTGFGTAHAALVACEHMGLDINEVTLAIEGFGNVGSFAAKYLTEWGAKIVAVSDSRGSIFSLDGIDFKQLQDIKNKTGSVINYPGLKPLTHDQVITAPADLLIPAALADVIHKDNVGNVKAKIVVEGANIPATLGAEDMLHAEGIIVVPDIVANAGGVISSYVEYEYGYDPKKAFELIENKIKRNVKIVLEKAEEVGVKPRDAALEIAKERVRKAM